MEVVTYLCSKLLTSAIKKQKTLEVCAYKAKKRLPVSSSVTILAHNHMEVKFNCRFGDLAFQDKCFSMLNIRVFKFNYSDDPHHAHCLKHSKVEFVEKLALHGKKWPHCARSIPHTLCNDPFITNTDIHFYSPITQHQSERECINTQFACGDDSCINSH